MKFIGLRRQRDGEGGEEAAMCFSPSLERGKRETRIMMCFFSFVASFTWSRLFQGDFVTPYKGFAGNRERERKGKREGSEDVLLVVSVVLRGSLS